MFSNKQDLELFKSCMFILQTCFWKMKGIACACGWNEIIVQTTSEKSSFEWPSLFPTEKWKNTWYRPKSNYFLINPPKKIAFHAQVLWNAAVNVVGTSMSYSISTALIWVGLFANCVGKTRKWVKKVQNGQSSVFNFPCPFVNSPRNETIRWYKLPYTRPIVISTGLIGYLPGYIWMQVACEGCGLSKMSSG